MANVGWKRKRKKKNNRNKRSPVAVNHWCNPTYMSVPLKDPPDHVCRGMMSPGMLSDTEAVQTHFTVMLQLLWHSTTTWRAGDIASTSTVNTKHEAIPDRAGRLPAARQASSYRPLHSFQRWWCFTYQHGYEHPAVFSHPTVSRRQSTGELAPIFKHKHKQKKSATISLVRKHGRREFHKVYCVIKQRREMSLWRLSGF